MPSGKLRLRIATLWVAVASFFVPALPMAQAGDDRKAGRDYTGDEAIANESIRGAGLRAHATPFLLQEKRS